MSDAVGPRSPTDARGPAFAVYALNLASFITLVTMFAGVVVAYIYRGVGDEWIETHYRYQIRTFWIGMLYTAISGILCLVLIGIPMLFLVALWWAARSFRGLILLERGEAIPNTGTWLI